MSKLLIFHADLKVSSQLILGQLLLIDVPNTRVDAQFTATSGAIGNQSREKQSKPRAGPIPSCDRAGIDHYKVVTSPINLKHVRGVEGNFYKINPHLVKADGIQRGDFGIHFDANVPGSAGCVVVRRSSDWRDFQKMMDHYRLAGLEEIPLIVSYAQ